MTSEREIGYAQGYKAAYSMMMAELEDLRRTLDLEFGGFRASMLRMQHQLAASLVEQVLPLVAPEHRDALRSLKPSMR